MRIYFILFVVLFVFGCKNTSSIDLACEKLIPYVGNEKITFQSNFGKRYQISISGRYVEKRSREDSIGNKTDFTQVSFKRLSADSDFDSDFIVFTIEDNKLVFYLSLYEKGTQVFEKYLVVENLYHEVQKSIKLSNGLWAYPLTNELTNGNDGSISFIQVCYWNAEKGLIGFLMDNGEEYFLNKL